LKDNEETWLYVYDLEKGKLLKYDLGNLANNNSPIQIDKLKSNSASTTASDQRMMCSAIF